MIVGHDRSTTWNDACANPDGRQGNSPAPVALLPILDLLASKDTSPRRASGFHTAFSTPPKIRVSVRILPNFPKGYPLSTREC